MSTTTCGGDYQNDPNAATPYERYRLLARIIHETVNNPPSGLRLRPAFAGLRSGLALNGLARGLSKPVGAGKPAPAGALFANRVHS